jgi:hypothetical protein
MLEMEVVDGLSVFSTAWVQSNAQIFKADGYMTPRG